ncbi:MAG: hypothetical protein Q8Q49_03710, partial [bacterium]|nr:hypothetical protein [bacterium]
MTLAEGGKEDTKETGRFLHNFPKRPKIKWLILGFVLLVGVILIADYLRYEINPRPLIGQVLDQSKNPIDGAVVVANNKAAVTRPEGTFRIQAKKSDELTVSAHGYETVTITAANPVATLSPLPPAVARVVVLGPDFKPAAKALVVRLDPNTQAPTAALITDAQGAAVFTRVPAGQAAFIALHPDFGMGWAETAIEASGFARPIIQLEDLKVDKRQAQQGLIRRAFAQESQDVELRNQLYYKFTDVRNVGENLFEITEKTRTMVAVSLDPDKLRTFINQMEEQAQSKLPDAETAQRLQSLLAQEGYDFPVQAKRIIPRWADTTYEVDKGVIYTYDPVTEAPKMTADSVDQVQSNVYLVEIQPATTARAMAFLQRDYAARMADSKPITVTNWAHLPIADVAAAMDGGTVYFDSPHRSVCCLGRSQVDTRASSATDAISSAISSTDVPASSLAQANKFGESPSVIFDPLDNSVKVDLSNLPQIKAQNQGLAFSQGGKTVNILDIEPPYPDDAPAEFIKGFFNSAGDALGDYLATPDRYKTAWQNYLHVSTSNARKNANITPSQLFNQLSSQIGANKSYRMTLPGFAE